MMDAIKVFVIAFVFITAQGWAWNLSAKQIAKECDKVGAFFVGDKVYDCKSRAAIGGAK